MFVVIAKGFGALKEIIIAKEFGVGAVVDAYSFLFNLLQWPIALFSAVVVSTLIPIIHKIKEESFYEEKVFKSEALGITLFISIIITIVYYIALKVLIYNGFFSFSYAQKSNALYFLNFLIFIVPFGFLASLFSAWTMASRKHINTLFEAVPSIGIIVFLLVGGSSLSLIMGSVIGFLTQASLLATYLYLKNNFELPKFSLSSKYWTVIASGFGLMLIGQFFMSCINLIDQYFAATLDEGSLSILNYGEKIMALFLSMATIVIGRAILPVFSKINVTNPKKLSLMSLKISATMLAIGLVLAIIVSSLSLEIVKIIFQRGAFTQEDSMMVASFLSSLAIQIPFFLPGMILSYTLISKRNYRLLALVGFVSLLVKIGVSYILIDSYKIFALAYSTVAVYFVSSLICLFFILKVYKNE